MKLNLTNKTIYLLLLLGVFFCFVLNISFGSTQISFSEVLQLLFQKTAIDTPSYTIIWEYRLPKAFTAILVGSGLGIAGLLMQTFFRNPLAGPYVLGVSSGASLGVALLILGGSIFKQLQFLTQYKWIYILGASLGSFVVLLGVLLISSKIKDVMSLLIVGLMLSSITTAMVSVLSYFATPGSLQQYIFWGFGSLGNLSWNELLLFLIVIILGIGLGVFSIKSLNSVLLGESYAKSVGVNTKKTRLYIILSTCILSGVVTAFSGPIAFIGLAIPYLCKQIFSTSNHKILFPTVILLGSIVMLICDTISQSLFKNFVLPINAITSLFGAPIIIVLLLENRKVTL